jgi:sec-independent protein translocase protein TatC
MTFNYFKYYKEFKNRFKLLLFAWVNCLNICYYYKERILWLLVESNILFIETSNKPYFIFTNITEVFYIYLEIVVFISNQIAIIILFYQVFMFLSLGLYNFEFKKLKLIFQTFIISWIVCSVTLFKIFVPFSCNFFLSFQENLTGTQSIPLFFEAKLSEYLQYFISLYYICLTSCQFFTILAIVLTTLNNKLQKALRKLFYLIFIIFSTVITPPDILSQVVISSILILIYELLIFIKEIKASMANN